ncbi:MAG: tetratricopeptide repeat protein [Armatimonadota bacterium]|nr:MAG: tetratricopeptide repeat protein [Armatimonadota bacterium]
MGKRRRRRTEKARLRREIEWPRVLGEVVLLAAAIVVPLVMNKPSINICDVKDAALTIAAALGLSMWLMASLARGRLEWVTSRLNVLVVAFGVWAGVTIFYSGYRYATISEFGRLAAQIGLYLLVVASLRSRAQVGRLIAAACAAEVPVCVYGFMQAAGRDPISWDVSPGRVFSFLGNATYLASFLVLVMPAAVASGWPRRRAPQETGAASGSLWDITVSAMFLGAAAMMMVCLYYSVTISPAIGLVFGTAIAGAIGVVRGGRSAVRAAAPWVVLALVVAGGSGVLAYRHLPKKQQKRVEQVIHLKDPYGELRRMQWRVAFELFRERPLLGGGYGTFRAYSLERLSPAWYGALKKPAEKMLVPSYAHNEYLQVLAGTGVIGGGIFFLLLAAMYATGWRVSVRHSDAGWRKIGLAITVGATAFVFQNFFGVTFRQAGAAMFFWLWLGVLAVAAASVPARGEERREPRVRQVRFAPLSSVRLALVGLCLMCALIVVCWSAVRPVMSNMKQRHAKRQARMGELLPEGQEEARRQHFKEAAKLAEEAIRLSPGSATAYYTAAYAWGQLGEYEKALSANQRALELLPGNASFEYNLGVTYLAMGEIEKAEARFGRAIELMPTSAKHQGAMADVLLQQKRIEEAVPYAKEALRLAPKDPKCHMLMADVQARRGNMGEVLKHLRKAIRRDPEDVNARQQLCELLLRLNKNEKAISACREWVRLDPTSARGWQGLGVAYYKVGEHQAAEKAFARAVEVEPRSLRARLRLAHSHLSLKKYVEAAREFEEVVRLAPESREGREAKAMLDRMRGGGERRARR